MKDASSNDLMLAVQIRCPSALILFHDPQQAHPMASNQRTRSLTVSKLHFVCLPALKSREEQIKFTLSDDEEEDS